MFVFRKSALTFLLVSVTSIAFAQGGATGAIGGVVQDSSGAVIAGAEGSIKPVHPC